LSQGDALLTALLEALSGLEYPMELNNNLKPVKSLNWLYTKSKLPWDKFYWKRLSAAAFDFAVENRSHTFLVLALSI